MCGRLSRGSHRRTVRSGWSPHEKPRGRHLGERPRWKGEAAALNLIYAAGLFDRTCSGRNSGCYMYAESS